MRGVRVNNQIPYVSKVKKWAEKTYNIKLETDTTDLFLYKTKFYQKRK